MSFWLDDDNNDDPWPSQQSQGQEHPASQQQQQQQLQSQQVYISHGDSSQQGRYQCTNCGGNESYFDDSTGADVCTQCFTQSQVIASTQQTNQNETDWDDVMGLAARTSHGHFIQHKTQKRAGNDGSGRRRGGRIKVPFDEYDQSVPLPDVSTCLRGVQCLLQKSATIIVMQILSKRQSWRPKKRHQKTTNQTNAKVDNLDDSGSENDDDYDERQREEYCHDTAGTQHHDHQHLKLLLQTIQKTVKELWSSYLHAWSIGAEYYGPIYPHIRFSFRDLFLTNYQVSYIVRRYIPHRITTEQQQQHNENENHTNVIPTPETTKSTHTTEFLDDDDDDDDDVSASSLDGINTINHSSNDPQQHQMGIKTKAKQRIDGRTNKRSDIRFIAIKKAIRKHTAHKQKGYKEVALSTRPSMTMMASFLYLAITKNGSSSSNSGMDFYTAGITYIDICDWIKAGTLPLLTAYHRLLTKELQQQLHAIVGFFRLDHPISPAQLEEMTADLCVACRLRVFPKVTDIDTHIELDGSSNRKTPVPLMYPAVVPSKNKRFKGDIIRHWSMSNLPYILARLVAMAGLNQDVLDRSLQLIGFDISNSNRKGNVTQKYRIPVVVLAEQLSRIDELLAIVAIACQLDPQWRDLMYMLPERTMGHMNDATPIIPWNESEIRTICNGPTYHQYINFVNQHILPDSDDNQSTTTTSILPPQCNVYTEYVKDSDTNVIRPCRVLAGASAPNIIEVTNRTFKHTSDLLIDYHKTKKQTRDRIEPKSILLLVQLLESPTATKKRKKDEKDQLRKQQHNKKLKFRRAECDDMQVLPNHDFYKADRCFNNSYFSTEATIMTTVTGLWDDVDQIRLVQYLGYVTDTNPYRIHRSMTLLLQNSK